MDKPIIRMSAAGHCPRAISAELLGYQPEPAPAWLEMAAREGEWHEDRIKRELRAERYYVHEEQQEVSLDFPSFRLIGHIDGKVAYEDGLKPGQEWKLLEIKSMSQFEFNRWVKGGFKEFYPYAAQVSLYMEATGLDKCLYIVRNRNTGYTDRRVLIQPPLALCEIIDRLTEAVNRALGLQLAEGHYDPESLECRRCGFKDLCIPEPREINLQTRAHLDSATEDWRRGKALIEEGTELVNRARECFEEQTRAIGYERWRYNGLSISLVDIKESVIYPKSKLLKVFTPEQLEPAAEVRPGYSQLRITDLTKAENEKKTNE